MNRDLTVGKPSQVLVRFSLPLLGSIVFQQLYNLADSFVAGKFLGDAALAAVGNAYEVTLIYLAFAFGCNVGCNVVLSLLFGAKEYGDLRTAVNTTFIASGVLCLILMALGFAQVRVRAHGGVARIEVPKDRIPEAAARAQEVAEAVRACGFDFAALDLDGYKMGSLNLHVGEK